MADVVVVAVPPAPPNPPPQQQQHLFVLPSIPSYNISLNLTSILALLPSKSFLTRSRLFRSIRRKWWEDVVDMHGIVPVDRPGHGEAAIEVVEGGSSTEGGGMPSLVDIAAWPTESMLEAVVNEAVVVPPGSGAPTTVPTAGTIGTPSLPGYPGPWGFFASGYMLGLFLVAVFLHRIQNIIVPSRVPQRAFAPRASSRRARRVPVLSRLWDAVFPLDLSKTTTRLVLHLPSLYFLSKVLLIWGVLILQTSQMYPSGSSIRWVRALGEWAEMKEMSDVCWKTFVAVCAGFAVEGFVKSLDGVEAGFPIGTNMNPNTSPFNIVGYAFLLHLYASPFAHSTGVTYRGEVRLPSRPDKHAVITVAIPLLQLTMFHALSVSKRLSTHRLLPTTLSSVLSLTHFHGALLSYFYGKDWWRNPTTATATGARLLTTYPILNYIPNIFETMLILTILLTVVLNVLVQLVVRGRVDKIFNGLGIRGSSSASLWDLTNEEQDEQQQPEMQVNSEEGVWGFIRSLPFEEDFGVLLLRVGTASLEATGLRGWSNEVAPVPAAIQSAASRRRRRRGGEMVVKASAREYGSVRMGRSSAGGVQMGVRVGAHVGEAGRGGNRRGGPAVVAHRGLDNEVRHVDIGANPLESGAATEGPMWRWLRAFGGYLEALWAAFKGLMRILYARLMRNGKITRRRARAKSRAGQENYTWIESDETEEDEDVEVEGMDRDRVVYERFLRGEGISDDEDEEYREEDEVQVEEDEQEESEEAGDGSASESEEREAFGLFSDLLRNGAPGTTGGGNGGEVVLAHLIDKSPMTRRRWQSLSSPDTLARALRKRRSRHTTPGQWSDDDSYSDYDNDDNNPHSSSSQLDPFVTPSTSHLPERAHEIAARSVCVICTTEARDVICWPCRCLAMCDGCREALAARSAPVKHRCPCCRGLVEGYSRIYIP